MHLNLIFLEIRKNEMKNAFLRTLSLLIRSYIDLFNFKIYL
ncbi:hypothetical protein PRO82_001540 [Candidatus Protochlamydia amoebophila]|nr:hypothetical protein [Candidatus Protochlamydia amoebophila]